MSMFVIDNHSYVHKLSQLTLTFRARPMIVCLCNALNDRKVEEAVAAGARSPHGVHRHHGTKIDCGQCLSTMASRIREIDTPEVPAPTRRFATAAE